jgi:hypothetical protein
MSTGGHITSMTLIDRVKLYAVEGSDGSIEKQLALTESSAINLVKNEQGRPDGVTYTATEITYE